MESNDSLSHEIEILEAELTHIHEAQKKLRDQKKQVAAVLDAKLIERAALEKLAGLSEAERAALTKALSAA